MKFSRLVTVFLIITIVTSGALILGNARASGTPASGGDTSLAASSATTGAADTEAGAANSTESANATVSAKPSVPVTTVTVSTDSVSRLEFLGTVKANDQIKVFATAAGQLQQVLAEEGSTVKAGDPLFVVGGLNGTKPAAQIQFEIAQKSYQAAQKGLDITKKGNAATLSAAGLQLDSARHLAEGADLDLQVFDQNIGAAKNGYYYLQDSYNATARNNELSFEKTQNGINDLKDAINNLEDQRAKLEHLEDQDAAIVEIDKTLEDLYSKLETAKIGYHQLEQARLISENVLLGQMAQSETTGKVLYLNQLSMEKKLGLENGTSDPIRLAEAGVNAAKIKNEASLVQAQTQLDLAKSNLELARLQVDSLIVKAPVNGIAGEVLSHAGDLVSQQTMLTQISGQRDYELRVAVDADSADLIAPGSSAEVEIGGKYVKVPVKNVSPVSDPATRTVNVTVALPKINFRANQTLKVLMAISDNRAGKAWFIPLDAVVIGTEEQYVFIVENGAAKKVNIKTGDVRGDRVQVLEGLSESDHVIVDGAKTLIDGQNVDVKQT